MKYNSDKAKEIREFLIKKISTTGGHIGANLSVVELTISIHNNFDIDNDIILYDTGHQGYTHKYLTNRIENFDTLNKYKGMSRFLTSKESKYDHIEASHAGTAISIACGYANSFNLNKENKWVVAVVGDGTLVEGMSFEGLNYASKLKNICIILNDNEIAIDNNVGSINSIMTSPNWIKLASNFFTSLGFRYFSIENGHDLNSLDNVFQKIKLDSSPVICHVKTEKGHGLEIAKSHPYKLHFSMPFNPNDITTTSPVPLGKTFAKVASEKIEELIKEDIIVLTPGTPYASELGSIKKNYPENYIDVGMAEQHIFGMAAGLALSGKRPIVNIQSTFMQRSFDQIVHDISFMNLNVCTIVVRSGFSGFDSPTHHGIFDISYLTLIPNLKILSPANFERLELLITQIINGTVKNPVFILLPYDPVLYTKEIFENYNSNKLGLIQKQNKSKILIITLSNSNDFIFKVIEKLKEEEVVINHFILENLKPGNTDIVEIIKNYDKIITIEQNVLRGGLGSIFSEIITDNNLNHINLRRIGIDDKYINAGSISNCLDEADINIDKIKKYINE